MIAFAMNLMPAGRFAFKTDDIISYADLTSAEGINLQRGMNFCVKPAYSIFLMSVRENAPYMNSILPEILHFEIFIELYKKLIIILNILKEK